MGTLSDITSNASNMKRRSNGSVGDTKGYKSLASPDEKDNHAKTKSPHFMTPTFASKQTTPPKARPLTPANSLKNKPFLRRVGLRRAPETPRSKKESPKKGLSFPDKVRILHRQSTIVNILSSLRQHTNAHHRPRRLTGSKSPHKTNLSLHLQIFSPTHRAHPSLLVHYLMRLKGPCAAFPIMEMINGRY